MASDRGTMTRGVDGAWPEPTGPAGRRLPSVPRERKPALAALAVVLIVGGALVAALLVMQEGHKTGAIEVTQTIGQGQRLSPGSLQEIQVTSGLGIDYVPWTEASQVTRAYAATTIPAGTLLTPQMTVATNNLAKGLTQVGLSLKDGELPDGLQVGDHVDVYSVSDSSGLCPRPSNFTLAADAVVLSIGRPLDTGGDAVYDVQVGVSPGDAGGVSCNAANGNVGLGIIPGNQTGSAAGQSSTSTAPGGGRSTTPAGGGQASTGATTPPATGSQPATTPPAGGSG